MKKFLCSCLIVLVGLLVDPGAACSIVTTIVNIVAHNKVGDALVVAFAWRVIILGLALGPAIALVGNDTYLTELRLSHRGDGSGVRPDVASRLKTKTPLITTRLNLY